MAVKDEASFNRVHRALDPLDGVRNTIVEQRQSIELRLDEVEQVSAGRRPIERGAEQIAVVDDDRLAADCRRSSRVSENT